MMKVSIVTATYNSAKTLNDAIVSVLNQSYSNIEYWIIDGCSTDGTLDIIQKYEKVFHGSLKWISERDKGIYDAMNKGISHCSGDIIGILNSDDFFTSNDVIERVVSNFTDDIEAVYGDVHFVKANRLDKCVRYYSGSIFRPWMVRFGFIAPHPSFYIRKNIYEKYGLYATDYQISADFELVARMCYKYRICTRYVHLDFVTMRLGGVSTRNCRYRLLGLKETIRACKRLGIRTNRFCVALKYVIKIYGFVVCH